MPIECEGCGQLGTSPSYPRGRHHTLLRGDQGSRAIYSSVKMWLSDAQSRSSQLSDYRSAVLVDGIRDA